MKNFELTFIEAAYGSNEKLPEHQKLQAGNIQLMYGEGSIRYLKVGSIELLRMIYFAVRDHNWDTIPAKVVNEHIEVKENAFEINFCCLCKKDDIDFKWDCKISGNERNEIIFEIKGRAESTFKKNRVGFCVLHPVDECAGKRCKIIDVYGKLVYKDFPQFISPHQPMMYINQMEWHPDEDITASLKFEGDIFEMEDQRNWTDDSYKTYCTPLGLPFPITLEAGEEVNQTITLKVTEIASKHKSDNSLVVFENFGKTYPFPAMGVGASSECKDLTENDLAILSKIPFHHYRQEINFSKNTWEIKLKEALAISKKLDTKLLLALFFSEEASVELMELIEVIGDEKELLVSIAIFHQDHKSTPESLIAILIEKLKESFPDVEIGAGTNAYFAELNRERVATDRLDFLTFSINPQVHAFDNDSLTETLAAQRYTVESTLQFSDRLPVHVSPVTLKPRFNPNATGPEPSPKKGELPSQIDVRQMSFYGAAWLAGSIRYLAKAKCKQITYFETIGSRGIIQGNNAPLYPEQFKSFKGAVFPVYHVWRFISVHQPEKIVVGNSSDRLKAELLLAVNQQEEARGILCNFTPNQIAVEINLAVVFKGKLAFMIVSPEKAKALMADTDYLENASFSKKEEDDKQFLLPPFSLIFMKGKLSHL